jgi:hypothetical protein
MSTYLFQHVTKGLHIHFSIAAATLIFTQYIFNIALSFQKGPNIFHEEVIDAGSLLKLCRI